VRCGAAPAAGAAVLTESGAFKALTLDFCEQIGLDLPTLTNDSAPQLRAALPEFVPVSNPVDLTAQALVDPDLYGRTLAALLQDARVGSIILGIIQTDAKTAALKFPPIIRAIAQLKPQKPVIFAGLDDGAYVPAEYIESLRALNVPYFASPERAYRAVARWCASAGRDSVADAAAVILSRPLPSGVLAEYQSKEILRSIGLAFPAGRLVRTLEEAQRAALDLGMPVVLKAQSADLPHKSDAGGVILGIKDAPALEQGWQRLHANIARTRPALVLDGVLIESMSKKGVELIVGGRNDPEWGAITLAGFGGVQAEILQDVRLLPADLTVEGIERELNLLKSAAILRGFRGSPALDVAAAADIISRVGALLRAQPSIREIDLNPVIIYPRGEGALALDALIVIS
jgi:acyl-CoA synthetase (NDP forming)